MQFGGDSRYENAIGFNENTHLALLFFVFDIFILVC